jgi:hypothetical protein
LPEPVGAMTSACSPAAAACHAPAWASVGEAKAPSNHCLVAGEKAFNASIRPIMARGSDNF